MRRLHQKPSPLSSPLSLSSLNLVSPPAGVSHGKDATIATCFF